MTPRPAWRRGEKLRLAGLQADPAHSSTPLLRRPVHGADGGRLDSARSDGGRARNPSHFHSPAPPRHPLRGCCLIVGDLQPGVVQNFLSAAFSAAHRQKARVKGSTTRRTLESNVPQRRTVRAIRGGGALDSSFPIASGTVLSKISWSDSYSTPSPVPSFRPSCRRAGLRRAAGQRGVRPRRRPVAHQHTSSPPRRRQQGRRVSAAIVDRALMGVHLARRR